MWPRTHFCRGTCTLAAFRVPLQPLEVSPYFCGGLTANVAVFLQRLDDDFFQLRRKLRIYPVPQDLCARFRIASVITPDVLPGNAGRPVAIS